MQRTVYYRVGYGRGENLPETCGFFACHKFPTFYDTIRDVTGAYNIPQGSSQEIRARVAWWIIQRAGSPNVSFRLGCGERAFLYFNGITEEEFSRALPQQP